MATNRLVFSVIIPTLNEELYLPKLLSDLSNQTQKNFEVIVVDGNSEDATKERAKEFKKKLNFEFISLKKRNLSYQKNTGAARAKGRYLIFLDADIRVPKLFIHKLTKEVNKTNHLVYLPALIPDGGTKSEKVLFHLTNFFVDISQNSPKPFATGGALIFQKSFFKFLGGYKERPEHDKKKFYPEDHDIIIRSSKRGVKGKFLKGTKIRFSLRRMKREGTFNVIKKYVHVGLEMVLNGELKDPVEYEMGGHVYRRKRRSKLKPR